MYPSEFGSDAPGYEAVEPDVLFSLTPTLLALFALALLAAVVVGWLAGRQNPERASDGARRIYEEIEDSVKDAVKAPQRQVADRAAKLHAAIRENLGPVLTLSGGLSGPYDALGDLLDGRKPDHGGRDHKDDHPDHEEHDEDKASPLKSLITAAIRAKVTIITTSRSTPGSRPDACAPPFTPSPTTGPRGRRGWPNCARLATP